MGRRRGGSLSRRPGRRAGVASRTEESGGLPGAVVERRRTGGARGACRAEAAVGATGGRATGSGRHEARSARA